MDAKHGRREFFRHIVLQVGAHFSVALIHLRGIREQEALHLKHIQSETLCEADNGKCVRRGKREPRHEYLHAAAQCVKLAACMHQRHYTGAVTLTNSPSGAWYDSYVEYALQNGILTEPFADYTTVLNRLQFVQIFYRALPVSCYGQINAIADDSIPDVTMTDTGAKEIYAFYRAGILTGLSQTAETAQYAFGAQKTITRAEVATILSRMVDTTTRRSFSIS